MQTFRGIGEADNKCLMRCAGIVRKHGWDENAVGMTVALSGPCFYYNDSLSDLLGFYPKEVVFDFMEWQEKEFGNKPAST